MQELHHITVLIDHYHHFQCQHYHHILTSSHLSQSTANVPRSSRNDGDEEDGRETGERRRGRRKGRKIKKGKKKEEKKKVHKMFI